LRLLPLVFCAALCTAHAQPAETPSGVADAPKAEGQGSPAGVIPPSTGGGAPATAPDQTAPAPAAAPSAEGGATTPDASPAATAAGSGTPPQAGQNGNAAEAKPAAAPAAEPAGPVTLTVATWGGAYGQSQDRAYFRPFEQATGNKIAIVTHGDGIEALRREAGKPKPAWDLVDLASGDLDRACADGLLVKLDAEAISPGAQDDFLPGAIRECGIGSVAFSAVPVFDDRAFDRRKPSTPKDIFDIARFPGKRSLPKGPRYNLELALLAAGTAPEEVYAKLSTPEGVTEAFTMLDKIKSEVIWWDKAADPLVSLRNKSASIALAFNGRAFQAIVAERDPFTMIWNGQIYDIEGWGIVKGSPHEKQARDFIRFATEPAQMALQAKWFPYGPLRKSALPLVGDHGAVPVKMAEYLPTAEGNFKTALAYNATFWAGAGEALSQRFDAWLKGEVNAAGAPQEPPAAEAAKPPAEPKPASRHRRRH
jgi:putative spermidine/putrescine transport system substrate-binding protein